MCVLALKGVVSRPFIPFEAGLLVNVVLVCAGLLIAVVTGVSLIVSAAERPRVVPYFKGVLKAPRSTWKAFNGGFAVASNLSELDELARIQNVAPLSSFGFSDDLYKQEVQWHEPSEGMRTVSALLESLRTETSRAAAGKASVTELEALAAVLAVAAAQGTAFSLLVRLGRGRYISGAEMGRRKGSFW
jgi:hypothetical protein